MYLLFNRKECNNNNNYKDKDDINLQECLLQSDSCEQEYLRLFSIAYNVFTHLCTPKQLNHMNILGQFCLALH